MKGNLSQMAEMTLEKGEELLAGQATAHIPQVGIFKLLAKKKVNGTIEWAHFVERDNELKEKVIRGTVNTDEDLDTVIDTVNNNLQRIFGVVMKPAANDVYTPDGEPVSETMH